MAEELKCNICEAYFRSEAVINGKCPSCTKLYPKAKTRDDIKGKLGEKARTLTEQTVMDIVYGILEDANIKRVPCEKCGKLFFKTTPAAKLCVPCRTQKAVDKIEGTEKETANAGQ